MAGLPISIVNRAKEILKQKFENNDQIFETLIDSKIINDVNDDKDTKLIVVKINADQTYSPYPFIEINSFIIIYSNLYF